MLHMKSLLTPNKIQLNKKLATPKRRLQVFYYSTVTDLAKFLGLSTS